MKQYLSLLCFVCFCVLFACGEKPDANLRSAAAEMNYNINNKVAATRLYSVSYNKEDSLHPKERFKMVHISDAHLSSYSSSNNYTQPKNLVEAVKFANQQELRINAMIATGDHISYAKKSQARLFLNSFFDHLFINNNIPTFPCYGNHDANTIVGETTEAFSKDELYALFSNYNNYPLARETGENYYYSDIENPMGGFIRIIALDMLDQPQLEYNTISWAVYSQKQIDWFCNKALKENMTDQHSIIVITHFPFESYSQALKKETLLIDAKFVHSTYLIPDIIEAFRGKTVLKKNYANIANKKDSISVHADFSTYPGDFICYMGGHSHITTQFNVTSVSTPTSSLRPQQMLLCTNMSPSEKGSVFNRVKRIENSLSDNSFCLYAIDTKERTIYITFFGAYLPEGKTEAEYPEIQVIRY